MYENVVSTSLSNILPDIFFVLFYSDTRLKYIWEVF